MRGGELRRSSVFFFCVWGGGTKYRMELPVSECLPAFFIARMGEEAAFRVGVKDGMLPTLDEGTNRFYFATSILIAYCYRRAISSRLKPVPSAIFALSIPSFLNAAAVSRAFW